MLVREGYGGGPAGWTTRCQVERQWPPLQNDSMSPVFTWNESATGSTCTHSPSLSWSWRPGTPSVASSVIVP